MKGLSWTLAGIAIGGALLAATVATSCPFGQTFLACLSGGAFSAFFSLFVGRLLMLQTVIASVLTDVKAWDSQPNPSLAHRIQIQCEILYDTGFSPDLPVMKALFDVPNAVKTGSLHGPVADTLYPNLKNSLWWPTFQSLFFPVQSH
jgi:hypothetical protein